MPTLHWIGKDKVINHHMEVPYRVLEHLYSYELGVRSDKLGVMNDELKNTHHSSPITHHSSLMTHTPPSSSLITSNSSGVIIHGDNLEALKALLPEYEGKIKCIYIDPPYNTGNEGWVYNDNVNDPKIKKWLGQVVGKESEDLSRHDKWLCMMYPRLKLLHKLLSDDGAIFISIDDNEQANLRLVCDEIFGGGNFIANVIWEKSFSPVNLKKHFSENHDFIVCYAKSKNNLICNGLPRSSQSDDRYKNPDNDPRGPWMSSDMTVGPVVQDKLYEIFTPSGKLVKPASGRCWLFTKDRFEEMKVDNRIWFGAKGENMPRVKKFLNEVKEGVTPMTIWKYSEVGHSQDAAQKLKTIFDGKAIFDYPKSVELIKRCLELYSDKNSIILDSFAGSGTTAHAVLNLNKQDGGKRKFILVEMEDYAETITAERVRRVMKKSYELGVRSDELNDTHHSSLITHNYKFDFYDLGQPMFLEDGNLNEAVGEERIRQYVYYTETKQNLRFTNDDLRLDAGEIVNLKSKIVNDNKHYLGKENDTAYYFHYEQDEVTTLDHAFLATMKTKAEQYVIYADNCLITKDFMTKHNIIFKKIPRDITRF